MVSKTIESNVYIFSETKNKTIKKPSVKKLTVLTSGLSGSNLNKAKKAPEPKPKPEPKPWFRSQ